MKMIYCDASEKVRAKLAKIDSQLEELARLKESVSKQLERAQKLGREDIAAECREDLELFESLSNDCHALYSKLQSMLSSWHDETSRALSGRIEAYS